MRGGFAWGADHRHVEATGFITRSSWSPISFCGRVTPTGTLTGTTCWLWLSCATVAFRLRERRGGESERVVSGEIIGTRRGPSSSSSPTRARFRVVGEERREDGWNEGHRGRERGCMQLKGYQMAGESQDHPAGFINDPSVHPTLSQDCSSDLLALCLLLAFPLCYIPCLPIEVSPTSNHSTLIQSKYFSTIASHPPPPPPPFRSPSHLTLLPRPPNLIIIPHSPYAFSIVFANYEISITNPTPLRDLVSEIAIPSGISSTPFPQD